jgi:hypothetical protein
MRALIAAFAVASLASFAAADTFTYVSGSHNPGQNYIVYQQTREAAPYTLTGREDARQQNAKYDTSIRVGNRVVVSSAQR